MTSFTVDLAELDGAVTRLDAFADSFGTGLSSLETTIRTLHQDWLGEAADAQAVAHERIARGAEQMHAAVLGLHRAARHAHASYTAAVAANTATWRQIATG